MKTLCRIIILSILLTFVCEIHPQSSWVKIDSPVSVSLRNCCFTDNLHGWASGDDGIIIHTSNGGNTFEIQNSTIKYYINDIFFINKRLGWVVANESSFSGTTILQTTNSGVNWISERFSDTTKFLRTIYFLDSLNGYMGGFGGIIYKTTNAGDVWNLSNVDSSAFSGFPISKIKFATANLGYACGGYMDVAGVVWRTINGGKLWTANDYSPEPFYDFFINDSQKAIVAGGDFEYGVQICKTSNGGLNWNYSSLQLFGQAYSIDFRTAGEAWMPLGYARSWAVSYDKGLSWISIPATDSAELYSVAFTDSLHGWAVGNNGVILKYVPTTVQISNINSPAESLFLLSQNFPNPFNPNTIINYQLTIMNFVSLKIYDLLGNEIKILVNELQSTGSYCVKFDGSNLPSGIYFYELKTGNFSETRKMLLLK